MRPSLRAPSYWISKTDFSKGERGKEAKKGVENRPSPPLFV